MDKNTLIGMLLMGAVVFGFMWLQQPSEEELAARRQQAEAQRIEAEKKAQAEEEMRMMGNMDTISVYELNVLKASMMQYGSVDSVNNAKVFNGDGVMLSLKGEELNGTIAVDGAVVAVNDLLNGKSSNPVLHNRALAKLRTELNKYVKMEHLLSI